MNLRINLLLLAAVLATAITIAPVAAHEEEEKENGVMNDMIFVIIIGKIHSELVSSMCYCSSQQII